MGISVLSSYQGAQIFEAVGIGSELIGKCFPGTPSQVEGVGFREIAMESLVRHRAGYSDALPGQPVDLGDPGFFRFRREGESHAVDAGFIKNFHTFVKTGKAEDYESYLTEYKRNKPLALHDLFELVQSKEGTVTVTELQRSE